MNLLDEFKKYYNNSDKYDDFDDYDETEVVEGEEEEDDGYFRTRSSSSRSSRSSRSSEAHRSYEKNEVKDFAAKDNVIQFHSTAKFNLKIIQPSKYTMTELNEIAELLEGNFLIFLDLGKVTGPVATRFVDFCCGFAIIGFPPYFYCYNYIIQFNRCKQ